MDSFTFPHSDPLFYTNTPPINTTLTSTSFLILSSSQTITITMAAASTSALCININGERIRRTATTPFSSCISISSSSTNLISNPFLIQKLSPFPPIIKPTTTKSSSCKIQAAAHQSAISEKVQQLHVYEFNEGDRGSPVYLRLGNRAQNSLGDLVPFTNKIYTGDLKKRLGVTAGMLFAMNVPNKPTKGDTYETNMSFYFGDYGHISCCGPYKSNENTCMSVVGGTGIFESVRGQVKVHNVVYPFSLYYIFSLKGIDELPQELTGMPVEPHPNVHPLSEARAMEPSGVVSGFTD